MPERKGRGERPVTNARESDTGKKAGRGKQTGQEAKGRGDFPSPVCLPAGHLQDPSFRHLAKKLTIKRLSLKAIPGWFSLLKMNKMIVVRELKTPGRMGMRICGTSMMHQ